MGQCTSGNNDRRRGRESSGDAPTTSQPTVGPSQAASSRYIPDMHYIAPTRQIVWVPQKPAMTERGYILLQPKNMGERALRHALEFMANIIHSKHNEQMTVVTIGGAINVLLLQEQNETDDVDILGTNLSTYHLKVLGKAATATYKANEASLGPHWFNNHALALTQTDIHEHVTKKALAQNEVIFHKPGLTLIAAPWYYAFCCAVARALKNKSNHPPHVDILNAVRYLRRYICRHGNRPVWRRTITDWLISIGTMNTDEFLRLGLGVVAACYQHQYGEEGIRGLNQSDKDDSSSWYASVRPRDQRRNPLYNIQFGPQHDPRQRAAALDIEFRQGAPRDLIGNIELREQDSAREPIGLAPNIEVRQRQGASRDPVGNIEAKQQDSPRERRGAVGNNETRVQDNISREFLETADLRELDEASMNPIGDIEARPPDNISRRLFSETSKDRRQGSPSRSAGNTEPRPEDEQRQRRDPVGNIEPRQQEPPRERRGAVGSNEIRQQDSPRSSARNNEFRRQDSPCSQRGVTGNIELRQPSESPMRSVSNIERPAQDFRRGRRGVTGNIELRSPENPPRRSIGNIEFTPSDAPREQSSRAGNVERRSSDQRRPGRAQREPTGNIELNMPDDRV